MIVAIFLSVGLPIIFIFGVFFSVSNSPIYAFEISEKYIEDFESCFSVVRYVQEGRVK